CFFEQKESAAEKFNSIELQIDESDREDPDDASSQSNYLSSLLESYKQAIDNEGTAFLFAVFRGSLAEGIDFSDDYCRLLFVVGMPFISPVCDEYDDMKHFLQQRHGKSDGARRASEWYMVQMKQALNQVLGRVLRHRRDFAMIGSWPQRCLNAFSTSPGFTESTASVSATDLWCISEESGPQFTAPRFFWLYRNCSRKSRPNRAAKAFHFRVRELREHLIPNNFMRW
ncbi:DNA repair helicase-like protein, partial [Dinothrombium tinctorium]